MKKGIFVKINGYPESSWKDEFDFAKRLGCDSVEFVNDYPLLGPSNYQKRLLNKIKNLAGNLELIMHFMPENYDKVPSLKNKIFDLASLDEKIKKFSLEETKKSLKIAEEIGAKILTVHGGDCKNKDYFQKNLEGLKDSLTQLNPLANKVKLCLENMPIKNHLGKTITEIPSNPDHLNYVVTNLKNIGITLDIGHANTVMPPINFLKKVNKIWNIHAHDNYGKDDHLPLGEGNINFLEFFNELKKQEYTGYFSLEMDISWKGKPKIPPRKERQKSWDFLKKYGL